jgi:polyisoprenoid-binding protein YceI
MSDARAGEPIRFLLRALVALAAGLAGVSCAEPLEDADAAAPSVLVGGPVGRPAPFPAGATAYCVDRDASIVRWRGTKVGGSHEGSVALAGGRLGVLDGAVVAGYVAVDMTSMEVTDLPDPEERRTLLTHLAHGEFFDVDRFPTATLRIVDVAGAPRGAGTPETAGSQRYLLDGNLIIRDSIHGVTLPVAARVGPEAIHATTGVRIDRFRWGVRFDGATSLLANAIVDDAFDLEADIVARRDACINAGTATG